MRVKNLDLHLKKCTNPNYYWQKNYDIITFIQKIIKKGGLSEMTVEHCHPHHTFNINWKNGGGVLCIQKNSTVKGGRGEKLVNNTGKKTLHCCFIVFCIFKDNERNPNPLNLCGCQRICRSVNKQMININVYPIADYLKSHLYTKYNYVH